MTSQFVTRLALGFMFLALPAGVNVVQAQTSLGWGQHVSGYGSGYVGNVPNTIPATSYYRAPAVPSAYPTTVRYAPAAVGYGQATGVSPAVSYQAGTANAAAYTNAYSPIVAPTTPYNANWQYPPQTVFPTTAQPVVANYAPGGYSAGYAPAAPYYTTNYARTPVTTYRPVTVMSPVTGTAQTVLQPCTGHEYQARRSCCSSFCSWLFHHHKRPVTPVVPMIPQAAPVVMQTNYPCPSPCSTGACPQPAPVAQPYYTPGATSVAPLPSTGAGVPANTIPSLSSPPPTYPLGSTIAPPSGQPLITTPAPNGALPGVPANQVPSLIPGAPNSSGPQRLDYPPVIDPAQPYSGGFAPNVSPAVPQAPAISGGAITPIPEQAIGNGAADQPPSLNGPALNGPANVPYGKEIPENNVPANEGARFDARPQFPAPMQQPPQAVIRRDSNITPIPDPESARRRPIGSGTIAPAPSGGPTSGTSTKAKQAPQLISPRDRTAQATGSEAQLASFEREAVATQPATPAPTVHAPRATAPRRVLGDDIWRSAK